MPRSAPATSEPTHGVDEGVDRVGQAIHTGKGRALLSVREAARLLGVTVSWVYEHLRPSAHDSLPHAKLGKYVRIHPDDLAAYIDAKRRANADRRCR